MCSPGDEASEAKPAVRGLQSMMQRRFQKLVSAASTILAGVFARAEECRLVAALESKVPRHLQQSYHLDPTMLEAAMAGAGCGSMAWGMAAPVASLSALATVSGTERANTASAGSVAQHGGDIRVFTFGSAAQAHGLQH